MKMREAKPRASYLLSPFGKPEAFRTGSGKAATLPIYRLAYIFNGFADVAFCLAPAFLNVAFYPIGRAFAFQFLIVNCSPNRLFNAPFGAVEFSLYLISVW